MSSPVITISQGTLMHTAQRLMKDHQIRRLVVVRGDEIAGIVTLGDIREAMPSDATTLSVWEINTLLAKLTVDKIMTRPVITVRDDETLFDAAQVMLERKIGGLPVLSAQGDLVGILTESDIFRMVIKLHTDELAEA
jgi:CBS domain-containing protein